VKNTAAFYCLGLIILFFSSCTKSDTTTNTTPPPAPPVVPGPQGSYSLYEPGIHVKQVQYFEYNASNQLAVVRSITHDSSSPSYGAAGVTDSFSITLNLTGTTAPPSSYDIVYQYHYLPPGGTNEHHELEYDAQNRVIRDSISDGTNMTNPSAIHFRYGAGGNPYCEHFNWGAYIYDTGIVVSTDTLQIDSENISYWMNIRNTDGYYLENDYTPSEYSNPLYNDLFAKGMGLALVVQHFSDFRSKNLPHLILQFPWHSNPVDFLYTWNTDSTGRVVSGYSRSGLEGTGPVMEIINYTYRN
jgi:hypothetical protein